MLNSIHVKIINLEHRADRRSECLNQFAQIGLSEINSKIFFQAKFTKGNGAIGCALSHAMVLSEFLFNETESHALILEDDFNIRNKDLFVDSINNVLKYSNLWDVYLLGHNQALPIENTPLPNNFRVINSQTASGYLVGRSYASKLIESFFRSSELLRNYETLPSPNKEIARQFFCCDMLWKELQIKHKYWASFPSYITQKESFSDIENKLVNYGV